MSKKTKTVDPIRRRICLVSCAKGKASSARPASELYTSQLFRGARDHVVASQPFTWFILSAKYGCTPPTRVIEPYDETLLEMDEKARVEWAADVLAELRWFVREGDIVEIYAGEVYRELIVPELESWGVIVRVPMRGLGIGQQLGWLKARRLEREAANGKEA